MFQLVILVKADILPLFVQVFYKILAQLLFIIGDDAMWDCGGKSTNFILCDIPFNAPNLTLFIGVFLGETDRYVGLSAIFKTHVAGKDLFREVVWLLKSGPLLVCFLMQANGHGQDIWFKCCM